MDIRRIAFVCAALVTVALAVRSELTRTGGRLGRPATSSAVAEELGPLPTMPLYVRRKQPLMPPVVEPIAQATAKAPRIAMPKPKARPKAPLIAIKHTAPKPVAHKKVKAPQMVAYRRVEIIRAASINPKPHHTLKQKLASLIGKISAKLHRKNKGPAEAEG
jgi:hypothetical protein